MSLEKRRTTRQKKGVKRGDRRTYPSKKKESGGSEKRRNLIWFLPKFSTKGGKGGQEGLFLHLMDLSRKEK